MGLDGQGATTGADSVCHTSSVCARTWIHARRVHSPERLKRRDRPPGTERAEELGIGLYREGTTCAGDYIGKLSVGEGLSRLQYMIA
jgi:hypothetical protein